ncbi:MAG: DUF6159 family protein [Nanoarchaeota archaeon]|nr:DUF6159 family protein [Nanoarchaeota archaeon]
MITEKLINAVDLTVESFTLLKKDKSLLIPPILSLVVIALIIILGFIFILLPAILLGLGGTELGSYIIFSLMMFPIYFVITFFSAALTWMVLEVKQGKDTTLLTGLKKAAAETVDIFLFSVTTLIVALLVRLIKGKKRDRFRHAAAGVLDAGWDVLGGLLLPSMILTHHTFFTAWKEIKEYRKTIPQVLAGSFGLGYIYTLIWLVFYGISLMLIFYFNYPGTGVLILLISSSLLLVYGKMIKTIYFALLYIQIKKLR